MTAPRFPRALLLAAALLLPAPAASPQPLGVPAAALPAEGGIRWPRPSGRPVLRSRLPPRLAGALDRADSLEAWNAGTADSLLSPYAHGRIAGLRLALGDSAGADDAWAAQAAARSPWAWSALRARADLWTARGGRARADSLLERADRTGWPDGERAEWLARRVGLRLALGDTAAALVFAGQAVARYPAAPGATAALRLLAAVHAARGTSLTHAEEAQAAEVDRLRGRRDEAADWLARAIAAGPDSLAAGRHLRRARVLREARRFAEARAAAAAALRAARSARDSLEARLERARSLRDAGELHATLAAYAEAARPPVEGAGEAWWERARFLEGRGKWEAAREDYARLAAAAGPRAEPAALRAGLMCLAVAEPGSALVWFERGASEAAAFWRGVTLRRTDRARGDSVLRALAARPGYAFYRAAARDTLGVRGWPGSRTPPPAAPPEPAVRLARALDELRCPDDAAWVLDRWAAGDPRLARPDAPPAGPPAGAWLEAARAGFRAGRPRQALRFVERALAALPAGEDSLAWAIAPWAHPPCFDSLFATLPESAAATVPDRALLRAVAWKESRFDAGARSRSDAIGLFQLKRAAVTDVAGWLRERAPTDSALTDPAVSLRYGSRYLARQLERAAGDLPLALAAYNAGPTAARRWTRLRERGGDALACEEIDFPETQDYVKTILAVRQGYRELRPVAVP